MALAVLLRVNQFFGFSPGGLVYPPARHGHFQPVQELRCRVDLVVVLAAREDRHLVEVFGKPGRRLGKVHKAVVDGRRLGVQTHDLVALRPVAGDAMAVIDDQLLDQLSARGLVFNQHHRSRHTGSAAHAPLA